MQQPNLDRLIDIQQQVADSPPEDAAGQPIWVWDDLDTDLPAEYLPVSGMEQFQAQQTLATAVARFRIRYREDLARTMRVIFDGQTWAVTHFEEDRRFERRQYLVVTAQLVAAP